MDDGKVIYSPYIPIEISPTSRNMSKGGKRDLDRAPTFICGACRKEEPGRWNNDSECGFKRCLIQHGIACAPKGWGLSFGKNHHGWVCSDKCGVDLRAMEVEPVKFSEEFKRSLKSYDLKPINPDFYGTATIDDL